MNRVPLLAVACCAFACAYGGTRPTPTLLQPTSGKILNVPAFGFFGSAQADDDGNIFIHRAPCQEVNILEIVPSSDDTVVYKLSDEQTKQYTFYDYSVTPGGKVWALMNEIGSPELRAIEFNSQGEAKTPVRLDTPEDIEATGFLALDSNVLFVSGNYTDRAAGAQKGLPFLGIFNTSGELIKKLDHNIPAFNQVKLSGGGELREGACTAADDGNAYFVDKDSVVSITPVGDVGKRTHFAKPASDLNAAGLHVSHGWAAIRFHKHNSDQTVEKSLLVIDLSTGEVMGWYQGSADVGYSDVGFSPNEGFTFIANDHGKMKIVHAKLR
jgi:hypothetical protein